jgi:hypothetical protein
MASRYRRRGKLLVQFGHGHARWRGGLRSALLWRVLTGLLFIPLLFAAAPVLAQSSRENELKAVFLWRLTQFTQWPSDSFEHPDSPVVICVLADNAFVEAVAFAVRGETAHQRKLIVQQLRRWDQLRPCHVLYIGDTFERQLREILAAVRGRSILTVSDIEGFVRFSDGMVRFLTEQNKVRLRINIRAVTAARLVLDPRLLRAAEIFEG